MNYLKYSKSTQQILTVETSVWMCKKENCLGWIREDFSFETTPICLFCKSEMVHTTKILPVLTNSFKGNY
ncbi:cold-inducible protein YdjO-related protein [Paenibacillus elgii]